MKRALPLVIIALAGVLTIGCQDAPTAVAPDLAKGGNPGKPGGGGGGGVTSIEVLPSQADVVVGGTLQLTAVAKDRKGNVIADVTFTWSSTAPTVAEVTQTGLVTGIAVGGPVTITASTGGKKTKSGSATVSVVPSPAASVTVEPNAYAFDALGETNLFAAVVHDGNGNEMAGQPVSWATSDPSVITVDDAGLVTSVGNGSAQVVAAFGTVSGSAFVVVSQVATMVTISPAAVTLTGTGQIQQFSAQVFDRNGYPVPDAGLTWTSLQPLVASVDATGLTTALANGEATILAQVGTAEATAVITVDIPSLIVFRSDHEGNWDLYSILSDGTNLRRLTQTTSAESEPAVSADGRSIAYTNNDDIWLMDIDGANPRQLTSSPVGARGPSWSPDGTRMAISYRVEAYYWPYALTVANGSLSQLVMGNTAHSELSWSHGSPVIAARYGVGSIAVFGVEQGESTVLASMHSVARPRFSPDGSRIAFGGQETDTSWWDIYVMDADGRNLTRYATATNDNHPTWSPDGRKIAFWRDGALWVMNADGTGATRLTYFTTGQIVEPSWYN